MAVDRTAAIPSEDRMGTPSIKGSIIDKLIEDVASLRERGPDMEALVEERLDAEALELLDTKVNPASWYPLTTYDQLSSLLMETEGRGSEAYLRARGSAIGERVMKAGLYQQLEFLDRLDSRGDFEAYLRDLRLIVSLQGALVSTGTWGAERDPDHADRVVLLARDLEGYPDTLCISTAGFMTGVSNLSHAGGLEWSYDRPSANEVRYRMDRDVSELS